MKEYDRLITGTRREERKRVVENRIRRVRSLEQEMDIIYRQLRSLGYVKLEKPLRDGWYRTLALRQDISRHKNAHVFQEILDRLGEKFWGREKKYADRAWKKKYEHDRHLYRRPDIRYIRKRVYDKFSTAAKRHFIKVKLKLNYRYRIYYYCTLPRYYFVVRYERAYITKRKIIAPELESRMKEIENALLAAKYYSLHDYNIYNYKFYYNPHKRRRRKTKVALKSLDFDYFDRLKALKY